MPHTPPPPPTESEIDRILSGVPGGTDRMIPRELAITISEAQAFQHIHEAEKTVLGARLTTDVLKQRVSEEGVPVFPSSELPPAKTEEEVSPGALAWIADKLQRIPSALTGGVLEATTPAGQPRDIPGAMLRGLRGQTTPRYGDVLTRVGVPELGRVTVSPQLTPGYSELRAMGYSAPTALTLSRPGSRGQLSGMTPGGRARLASEVVGTPAYDPTRVQLTGRGALGLAMDILFDPQMYLSAGTSRALKIGELVGNPTVPLSGKGVSRLRDLMATHPAPVTFTDKILVQTTAQRDLLQEISRGATDYVHPGGLAFGGAHIPGSQLLTRGAARGISAIDRILKGIPIEPRGGPIAQAVGKIPHEGAPIGRSPYPKANAHDLLIYLKSVFVRDALVARWEPYITDKQAFLNRLAAAEEQRVLEAEHLFRGTTPSEQVMIHRASQGLAPTTGYPALLPRQTPTGPISDLTIGWLSPHLQPIAAELRTRLDALRALDAAYGLGRTYREDYMPHPGYVYHPGRTRGPGDGRLTPTLSASKTRELSTLYEAKQLGLVPRTENAAEAYVIRTVASDRARLLRDLLSDTARKFGTHTTQMNLRTAIEREMSLLPFSEQLGTPMYVPKPLADDLLAMVSVGFITNPVLRAAIRGWDALNNFIKGSLTSVFPAFQVGNAYSNVFLAWLHAGLQVLHPLRHLESMEILAGRPGLFSTRIGLTYTYDEIRTMLKEEHLLGAFQHKIELIGHTQRVLREPIPHIWSDPNRSLTQKLGASAKKIEPYTWGRAVGSAVEDEARLAVFLSYLKRGTSPRRAAAEAKLALFDYENLSATERDVFRRVFLFYTFTRKNMELQARAFLTEPGRQLLLTKLFHIPGDREEGRDLARYYPVYLHDGLLLETGLNDPQGNPIVISALRLPIEDINKVFSPAPSGEGVPGQLRRAAQKTFMAQLGPVLRGILETTLQKDLSTGADLTQKQRVYDIVTRAPDWLQRWLEVEPFFTPDGKKTFLANPAKVRLLIGWSFNRFYTTGGQLYSPDETQIARAVHLFSGLRIAPIPLREQKLEGGGRRAEERAHQARGHQTQATRQLLFEGRRSP